MVNEDFRRIRMTFSAYNHQKSHIPAKIDLRHIQKTLHARNISAYHSRIQKTPTKKDPRHIQKTPPKPRFESLSKSHARSPFRPQLPGFTPYPHTSKPYRGFPARTRGTGVPYLRLRSWHCLQRCLCCIPCAFSKTDGAHSGCALSQLLRYD